MKPRLLSALLNANELRQLEDSLVISWPCRWGSSARHNNGQIKDKVQPMDYIRRTLS